MKKIFTYSGIFLSVVLMGILSSCTTKEIQQSADLGLNIKVFSPTKVVAGQPMTINGSGFGDVKEIIFPNAVSVTDFEIVSNEMIRVTAPAGISAEGGKLIVRTDKDQVESPLPITIGSTSISGYSKQEGEEVEGGSQLTVFGKDLEFIYAVKLLNADGLPNIITHEDFYRKGTSSVVITIPKTDIYEGSFKGVVYTYDGKSFEMPEFAYKPKQGGGHWEKVKTIFWENKDGEAIPAWGGKFRFGLEGTDGNNECIATFPAEQWAIIKDGLVRASVALTDASNIRITTGWWSGAYGGTDHNCTDFVQEDEDGNTFIELNIKEEGTLYDLIDQQHLLFTGSDYTLLEIYNKVWVEGGEAAQENEDGGEDVERHAALAETGEEAGAYLHADGVDEQDEAEIANESSRGGVEGTAQLAGDDAGKQDPRHAERHAADANLIQQQADDDDQRDDEYRVSDASADEKIDKPLHAVILFKTSAKVVQAEDKSKIYFDFVEAPPT